MSDIVERLRLQNDCLLGTGHDFSDVLLDAAAEIKRLRGLLGECIEWVEFKENGGLRYAHGVPELVKRVREALGER